MGIRWENDCVCCADGCHGCGRNKNYPVRYCDDCQVGKDQARIYRYGNKDLCLDCLIEQLIADGEIYEVDGEDD